MQKQHDIIKASITYGGKTYTAACTVTVYALSISLSPYSGSAATNVYDDGLWTHDGITEFGHKSALPTVSYAPSWASYTWNIISGYGFIGGNQNLYVTQPGKVVVRCTLRYNGYTTYTDYTFTQKWYKVTTANNNARTGPGTEYEIVGKYPADTTLYFDWISYGTDGNSLWGRVDGNWVIISQW